MYWLHQLYQCSSFGETDGSDTAGTTLEFVKHAEWDEEEYIEYEQQENVDKAAPIETVFADTSGFLRQSMPSLNTAKPLVLLVEFPDYSRPRFITPEGIEKSMNEKEEESTVETVEEAEATEVAEEPVVEEVTEETVTEEVSEAEKIDSAREV